MYSVKSGRPEELQSSHLQIIKRGPQKKDRVSVSGVSMRRNFMPARKAFGQADRPSAYGLRLKLKVNRHCRAVVIYEHYLYDALAFFIE